MLKLKTSNCHSSSQQLEEIAESDSSESEREEESSSSEEELDDGDERMPDGLVANKKVGSAVLTPRISNGITGR